MSRILNQMLQGAKYRPAERSSPVAAVTRTLRRSAQRVATDIDWPVVRGAFFAVVVLGLMTTSRRLELGNTLTTMACIAGLIFLLFGVQKRPELSVYALVMYLPFSREMQGDFGGAAKALNLTNLLCLMALFSWFASRHRLHLTPQRRSALGKGILVFCVLGGVSLVRSATELGAGYLWAFLTPLKQWLTPMLIYYLVRMVVHDRRVTRTIIVIIMLTVSLVSLLAIKDYELEGRFASSIEKARIGGIAEQPNMLGAFFVNYGLLMAGVLLMFADKPKTWWLTVPLLLLFRGVQVTFSRGAYLALALGAVTIAFFRSKFLWFLAVGLLVAAVMTPALLPKGIRHRVGGTVDEAPVTYATDTTEALEPSARNRIYAWRGAIRMIQQEPIFGIGYGLFARRAAYYAPELRGAWIDAHNEYLLIAAEMGLPMMGLFIMILWLVFRETYWVWKHCRDPFLRAAALGFLGGLVGLMTGCMFGSRLQSQEISGYFWVLAALMTNIMVSERIEKRKTSV